jgi:hypothetical protein
MFYFDTGAGSVTRLVSSITALALVVAVAAIRTIAAVTATATVATAAIATTVTATVATTAAVTAAAIAATVTTATISTTATTTTVASATAVATTISATAMGTVFGLFHHEGFAIARQGDLAEHFNGFLGLFVIFHDDETESTALAGFPVHGHFCGYHLPEFLKNLFEFSIVHVVGKARNKQSHI